MFELQYYSIGNLLLCDISSARSYIVPHPLCGLDEFLVTFNLVVMFILFLALIDEIQEKEITTRDNQIDDLTNKYNKEHSLRETTENERDSLSEKLVHVYTSILRFYILFYM